MTVTVAVPTLDAGPEFTQLLEAVRSQDLADEIELLVCDSGSRDGTAARAREHGARVIEIPQARFGHGTTRNLLMSEARGDHVAFLTQDAVPAAPDWLSALRGGFDAAADVGLVFGPYRPRPEASVSVARELTQWFQSISASEIRVDRLSPERRGLPAQKLFGVIGYFTDANGMIARSAWQEVPFRPVAYAEDHLLAQDMLRAGWAKTYVPEAAVIHSHEYTLAQWLRRGFDEARALAEVYEGLQPPGARALALTVWGNVGADWRWSTELPPARRLSVLPAAASHHLARACGTALGGRSRRLPPGLARTLSLERRSR